MTREQRDLWHKLERFHLDDPSASFSFSARLAEENGWTIAFARRVAAEYKRFVFLCLAAGHPCTPSEEVDQSWHLHLLYTRSYWDEFCGQTLGQPLHHGPTKGGTGERSKYLKWYVDTLASYRSFFGDPPQDIWPPPESRFGPDIQSRRVNTARNWVIRKPNMRVLLRLAGFPAAVALMLVGCGNGPLGFVPIFDWSGPRFLVFYLVGFILSGLIGLTFLSWWDKRQEVRSKEETKPTDIYILAGMAGGGERIAHAALTGLVAGKALESHGSSPKWIRSTGKVPENLQPFETSVLDIINRQAPLTLEKAVSVVKHSPATASLLARRGPWEACPIYGKIPLVILGLAGAVKTGIGLSRDRPVGFLVIFIILTGLALAVLEAKRQVAKNWQQRLAARIGKQPRAYLNLSKSFGVPLHNGSYFALVTATSGLAGLAGTALEDFAQPLIPPAKTPFWQLGGDGCSSGSSGCGSGGGCGGGGCGGCSS